MVYVISDLHGYPHDRFLKLLKKANFSEHDSLYILGDIVDRNGDGGVATLNWLLYQYNAQLILGNHEFMLLGSSFIFDEVTEDSLERLTAEKMDMLQRYMADGGEATIGGMHQLDREDQQDILEYLRECPLYEMINVKGKDFILVHAGFDSFSPDKSIEDYTMDDLLWKSPQINDRYYKDAITVLGHRPTFTYGEQYKDKIIKTETWIDIDMGAGFGQEPVLLRLDDMAEFRLDENE